VSVPSSVRRSSISEALLQLHNRVIITLHKHTVRNNPMNASSSRLTFIETVIASTVQLTKNRITNYNISHSNTRLSCNRRIYSKI